MSSLPLLVDSAATHPPEARDEAETLESFAQRYITAGSSQASRKVRRAGRVGFEKQFTDLDRWLAASVAERRAVRDEVASFVGHALVACKVAADIDFAIASGCHWGIYVATAYPDQHEQFQEQASSLGFCPKEIGRMWSWLAKICLVTGTSPSTITAEQYQPARTAIHDAVIVHRGYRPQSLSTPLFGSMR